MSYHSTGSLVNLANPDVAAAEHRFYCTQRAWARPRPTGPRQSTRRVTQPAALLHLTPWRNPVELRTDQEALAIDSAPAHVAQLVEHTLGKGEAMGSIPIVGSG